MPCAVAPFAATALGFITLPPFGVFGVGHCKDEYPFSPVGCTDFLRRKQTRRNSVTHSSKISANVSESQPEMSSHVFEEAPSRTDAIDDMSDVRPEVALVVGAEAFAGDAERLARVASNDSIHDSASRRQRCFDPEIESSDARTDREHGRTGRRLVGKIHIGIWIWIWIWIGHSPAGA